MATPGVNRSMKRKVYVVGVGMTKVMSMTVINYVQRGFKDLLIP